MLSKTIVALLLLVQPSVAFAWGGGGHRIICAIAWDEMTPAAREKALAILSVSTKEDFAQECNWADTYRRGHPETSGWHFIDVPPGERSVNLERDCSGKQSCAPARVLAEEKALRENAAGTDRAASLKFLMHFVGDIHQPLHVTEANGDNGGNKIEGRFMGRKLSYHAIWDSWMITNAGSSWQNIAQDLESKITRKERADWQKGDPATWANESLAISLSPEAMYVDQVNGFDLGEDFEKAHLPIVYDRLSRAGVRLGHILNETLR